MNKNNKRIIFRHLNNEINKIKKLVRESIVDKDFILGDVLTAYCFLALELACDLNVPKPIFLSSFSNLWEEMDKQLENE